MLVSNDVKRRNPADMREDQTKRIAAESRDCTVLTKRDPKRRRSRTFNENSRFCGMNAIQVSP